MNRFFTCPTNAAELAASIVLTMENEDYFYNFRILPYARAKQWDKLAEAAAIGYIKVIMDVESDIAERFYKNFLTDDIMREITEIFKEGYGEVE